MKYLLIILIVLLSMRIFASQDFDRRDDFLKALVYQPQDRSVRLGVKCIDNFWEDIYFNHGINVDTFKLYGKQCSYGFTAHAPSEVEISLNKAISRFTCFVGQEDSWITETIKQKYMKYKILGDGKELWHGEGEVNYHTVDIDVSGIDTLTLISEPIEENRFDYVVWGDVTCVTEDGKSFEIGKTVGDNNLPISFVYNGEPSGSFLYKWKYTCERNDNNYKVTYEDPETGLALIIEAVSYKNDAALWWDVYFENRGSENSKQISQVKVLDGDFKGFENPILHSAMATSASAEDFKPIDFNLKVGKTQELWTVGGKSSNYHMPYFNINSDNKSIIGAIGWSAQWRGKFTKIANDVQNCSMGLDDYVDFYVKPGEKLQMPSMCLVFTNGDFEANQNDFRKFLVDYIIPEDKVGNDKLMNVRGRQIKPAPITVSAWGGMRTSEFEKRINAIGEHKLPYEYYWVDAGWYGPEDSYSPDEWTGDWSMHVGNWQANPKAHPKGIRYLSDRFGEIGLKFLLWVELQRAIYGTPAYKEHPEFWIGKKEEKSNLYLDMSNDKACEWAIDFMKDIIEKYNIKCFREDYNFEPIEDWKKMDPKGRKGITEIKAVYNGYRLWKELLAEFPDLIIDNCAGGGRRLDINMAKMAFTLWRTDYQCRFEYDPIAPQLAQNWLTPWYVNQSTGTQQCPGDTFRIRSCMATGLSMHFSSYEKFPIPEDYPYEWHKQMLEDYKRIRPYFYGNYYSLMPAKLDYNIWISYEMYREDIDEGCVFVFREEKSDYKVSDILIKGINPNKTYIIEDLDDNSVIEAKGKDLTEKGLEVLIPNKRQSKLFVFKAK